MKTFGALSLLIITLAAQATPITPDAPIAVRILYDNSGSMYPGYRPPGSPGRQTREQLGVHFFHQTPAFPRWLDELVQRQSVVGGDTAGMWTFTSNGPFVPTDIQPVHPVVPLREFRAETAVANFPVRTGNSTYLSETLVTFTRNFTGLVWLITDNIVEANAGEPDAGVQHFFETLARSNELRSVHLFKVSFEENGHTSALAVYAVLVSAEEVPDETLANYDGRFREMFPGREHLKLKNLAIEPLTLHAGLQLVLADRDRGMFQEGQSVQLALEGEIRSHLTQHAVTAGRYELAIATPFVPEPWAQTDLGARPLAADLFDPASGEIANEIPPNGTRHVQASLRSNQPVSFTPSGLGEWLRLAWNGAAVRYTGNVRMSLTGVSVQLQRRQMAGIFGIDHASSVFAFQDVTSLSGIRPSTVPVSFALRTGSSRTAVLLIVLVILAAIAVAAGLLLSRKQTFRITIANTPERIAALRRLGSHDIVYEGTVLGRLARGLVGGHDFQAVSGNPSFTIMPTGDTETWDIKFTGGPIRRLLIKAEGIGPRKRQKTSVPAARAGPPPPPPPLSRNGPPPGRPPRLGR
ncbi:MAG: hypothetical protein ABI779_23765 [Acidobacteriota bacterium]